MKILGLDPGYGIVGWSIVEKNFKLVDYGSIETSSQEKIENRLFFIHTKLNEIINFYQPDCAAVEKIFFTKNSKTIIDVSKAIGVISLTLKLHNLSFGEYTPLQIKKAMTGFGRASKEQMQTIMKMMFKLKEIPKPDDAADALAVAACHSFSLIN